MQKRNIIPAWTSQNQEGSRLGLVSRKSFAKNWQNLTTNGLLSLLLLISFSPCLKAGYLNWDDGVHFETNPLVYNLSWENLLAIFTQTINGTYIPLTTFSFHIEYHLLGLPPWRVHLENILLHLGVVLMVVRLSRQIGLKPQAALTAAALFAVHPLHVESVAWAAERKDVLCTLFYLLSLSQYQSYLQTNNQKIASSDNLKQFSGSLENSYNFLKGRKNYILSVAWGFLSVLAKPMAVSLPWILFAFDWFSRRPFDRKSWLDKIPFAVAIFPVAAVTFLKLSPHPILAFPDSILSAVWSFAFYLEKFLLPVGLLPLYTPPQPVTLANPVYLKAVVIALLFLGTVAVGRKNRLWIFACLFWAGSIFFFWRFDFKDINVVADRFMYLPSMGFCLFLGYHLARFPVVASGLVVVLGILTFNQCQVWNNDVSLWSWTLKNDPKNTPAREKLYAAHYFPHQNKINYKNFDEILNQYSNSSQGFAERGRILLEDGKPELAFEDFSRAIALDPQNRAAYNSRGLLHRRKRSWAKALEDFNRSIALKPNDPLAYVHKALIFKETNNIPQAFQLFELALKLDPKLSWAYYERGNLLRQLGREADALEDFTLAIAFGQTTKDSAAAANPLSSEEITATAKNSYYQRGLCKEALQHWEGAQEDFKKVLENNPYDTKAMTSLGGIYVRTGRLDQAMEIYNKAIALDPYFDKPYNNRGIIFLKKGEYDQALNDFTKAIERSQSPYHALITRGDIFLFQGKPKQALNDYTAATHFAQNDPIAAQKLKQLRSR